MIRSKIWWWLGVCILCYCLVILVYWTPDKSIPWGY